MTSAFDVTQLLVLLEDFYRITGIRITVFDENLRELVSQPAEVAPCCRMIRSCSAGMDACLRCDRDACAAASKRGGLHIYRCHAGLTEAVIPLTAEGYPVGYLLFGHVFSYPSHEEGWKVIARRCERLPIDLEALRRAVFACPIVSEEYIQSAAHILHAVASYLILEHMATVQRDQRAAALDAWLSRHYTEPVSAPDLCRALGIGKTQLYKLSRQLYGCGAAKHIRDLRMALAKELLRGEDALPLAEIANRCGYRDYNYFITVFTREVGMSPGAYRAKG